MSARALEAIFTLLTIAQVSQPQTAYLACAKPWVWSTPLKKKVVIIIFFTVLGIEPSALCILGKHSFTALQPNWQNYVFKIGSDWIWLHWRDKLCHIIKFLPIEMSVFNVWIFVDWPSALVFSELLLTFLYKGMFYSKIYHQIQSRNQIM